MVVSGKSINILILFVLLGTKGFSFPTIQIDTTDLAKVKQKIHGGTASERTMDAYKALLSKADKWLAKKNPTVMDKTITPPTGDHHDYLSISRYWWPNPDTPDGLPWIRKDGETNPETQTDAVDRRRLGAMAKGVKELTLAYYFSNDGRYAQKAASMVRTWFLDGDTRMNPHLQFAQGVPGVTNGKSSGILDGKSITSVVPGVIPILSKSPYWNKEDTVKVKEWLSEYLRWLTESELGHKENDQKNNHGSWYKYQVATLALYLDNKALAKKNVVLAQQSLGKQLDFEGKQIHELARTRSFFYSCYNLDALTRIAMVGDKVGMDMWNYTTKDNKGLSLAVDFLAPVVHGEAWQYTDIHGVDLSNLVPVLVRMSKRSDSKGYTGLLSKTIAILVERERSTGIKNKVLEALSLSGEIAI
ncbi:alginate lyase family protein [Maribacter sp. ANRC-HE7]|uniref:Alginate lyase family protein n=1 Tax=Maribacter aquimaris TaxID=2737171 RepID=A0ABR7V370_9FLAO|nr:alginate lyase family protein [Maribacter aquimaris]MBD0777617.1 alginate lyase family protein [Maribacter aquimaris]